MRGLLASVSRHPGSGSNAGSSLDSGECCSVYLPPALLGVASARRVVLQDS